MHRCIVKAPMTPLLGEAIVISDHTKLNYTSLSNRVQSEAKQVQKSQLQRTDYCLVQVVQHTGRGFKISLSKLPQTDNLLACD